MLRTERRRRRYLPVLILVLLGAGIGVWHNVQTSRGRSDFITSSVRAVTAPFVSAAGAVGNWFGRQLGWLVRGRSMAEENRRLRSENDYLKTEIARLAEADATVQRLRTQLGLSFQIPAKRLAADIISRRLHPHSDDFVIRRGSRDGVKKGMTVVASAGLVGQVYDVGVTHSVVVMITDPSAAVGAMVQRPRSRAIGVCRGTGTDVLAMHYMARDADIKVGDVIISSGLGGTKAVYPKGIPIGTVVAAAAETSGASMDVTVKPSVLFDRLEEVYVLQ